MGFAKMTSAAAGWPMGPKDLIRLAALGTAAREPATIDTIGLAIDDIADQLWSPVGDVIASTMEELLKDGALHPLPGHLYETTESGHELLAVLFGRPVGRPGCLLGQVGFHLKLAFIDLAAPDVRHHTLTETIHAYESEIIACEKRCRHCSLRGAFGRLWQDHEAKRLRRDLSLLHTMAAECGGENAATAISDRGASCATH